MIDLVVLWQTVYTQAALDHLAANGHHPDPADVARLTLRPRDSPGQRDAGRPDRVRRGRGRRTLAPTGR
jgi:hypothetical protein